MEFSVKAKWDAEARVWYVAESDVPGLAAEADTLEELRREIVELVPELLEVNAHLLDRKVQQPVRVTLNAAQEMAIETSR